jgi:hypothetical protein
MPHVRAGRATAPLLILEGRRVSAGGGYLPLTNSAGRCTAAIRAAPCRLEAGVTTRTAGSLPAWQGCRREAGATSERNSVRRRIPHPLSLAPRQDRLSTGKSANFLPVGKDFTIPAPNFLPVGKGLRVLPERATKRHTLVACLITQPIKL